jgi:hypothetical protein
MQNEQSILEIIEKTSARRDARRAFMRTAVCGAAAVGGLSLLSACGDDDDNNSSVTPAPTPTPTTAISVDFQVLNFALQLEYLEAQFYSYAAFGVGLPAASLAGIGNPGQVETGTGAGFPRAVDFSGDPVIGQYAREIALDEIAHVNFLRAALGASAAAQPAINISGNASGAFTAAARAAGVVGATGVFDPYATPISFLVGAYIFEDVGVTAYKGASPLLSSLYLEAAAGILAAEAYHAGLVRTILYARGVSNSSLITQAQQISNLRDTADGRTVGSNFAGTTSPDGTNGTAGDRDQGVGGTNIGVLATGVSNIVPTDANGIAYSRSPADVLNIVFLNPASTTSGGFFPAGVNGSFTVSGANT